MTLHPLALPGTAVVAILLPFWLVHLHWESMAKPILDLGGREVRSLSPHDGASGVRPTPPRRSTGSETHNPPGTCTVSYLIASISGGLRGRAEPPTSTACSAARPISSGNMKTVSGNPTSDSRRASSPSWTSGARHGGMEMLFYCRFTRYPWVSREVVGLAVSLRRTARLRQTPLETGV